MRSAHMHIKLRAWLSCQTGNMVPYHLFDSGDKNKIFAGSCICLSFSPNDTCKHSCLHRDRLDSKFA